MADKPADKSRLLPRVIEQNPAPVDLQGQDRINKRRQQVDRVMEVFLQVLPSNYVSQVTGPLYTVQMQAAAEAIADFQLQAQETFADTFFDYTRSEFLFQILGTLVFPDATTDGYPDLKGDITYRDFLKEMVKLLLGGATKTVQESGLALLSEADFEVVERVIAARSEKKLVWDETQGRWQEVPGSAWGLDDQFVFEVNVSYTDPDTGLQRFPEDPFVLSENARIVLRALKPAHSIYEYRHLFRETFGTLFEATASWDISSYYYEDFRKWCCGAKQITGTAGQTLTDRRLFSDVTRDFGQVAPESVLRITSGSNVGETFRVEEVRTFPVGDDATPRAYTTSPTGLTGEATVSGDDIEDASQDWSTAVEGEVLTFSAGPNAGSYRLKNLLGTNGGPVGKASGPATRVRVAPCLLRLKTRMRYAVSGQSYTVSVDRLGEQEPQSVDGEDATVFFLL